MSGPTYYAVLGVAADAAEAEIKKAFRKAARALHPDMNGGVELPAYLMCVEAHEVLTDPARRAAYDAELAGPRPAPPPPPRPDPEPEWGVEEEIVEDPAPVEEDAAAEAPAPSPAPEGDTVFVHPRTVPSWARWTGWGLLVLAAVLVYLAAREQILLNVVVALVTGPLAVRAVLARRAVRTLLWGGIFAYSAYALTGHGITGTAAVLAAAAGYACLKVWRRGEKGTETSLGRRQVADVFSWGRPGAVQDRLGQYGPGMGPAGSSWPQKLTAELLGSLADIPGVRVFHGVHAPGTNEIVDHVVTCGNRAVVVNSMLVPDRDISWGPAGAVVSGGAMFPQTIDASVLRGFARVRGLRHVAAVVVAHRADGGQARRVSAEDGVVVLAGGRDAMELVRSFLLTDNDARRVDLTATKTLYDAVVE